MHSKVMMEDFEEIGRLSKSMNLDFHQIWAQDHCTPRLDEMGGNKVEIRYTLATTLPSNNLPQSLSFVKGPTRFP